MDAERFDRIARILAVAPSRRDLIALALGGAAVVLSRAETASRKKGKKKKCGACGACKTCVKGRCKAKPDGAGCGDGDICQGGVCGCDAGFEPCGGACVQSCSGDKTLDGSCQCACPGGTQDCGGNVCQTCCDDNHCGDQVCCTGECRDCCDNDDCDGDRTCQGHACLCPANREDCGDVCCAVGKICADADTSSCVTGRGSCQEGADTCPTVVGNPQINCNARVDCFCFQSMSGDTRCGQFIPPASECGECEQDDDCESTYGLGTFCVAGSQPSCCVNGGNICAAPCSTDPPDS